MSYFFLFVYFNLLKSTVFTEINSFHSLEMRLFGYHGNDENIQVGLKIAIALGSLYHYDLVTSIKIMLAKS